MKTLRWCLAFLWLTGFACQAQTTPSSEPTTILVVRHAEKADDGTDDPPLAPEGTERAELLARMLRDADVDAIYATRFRRNQETAAPLARVLGLEVNVHEVQGEGLADMLLEKHPGETVFVVGHSNTVPMLLDAFVGEEQYAMLDEQEYDALFVITARARGPAEVAWLRFGE